MWDLDLLAKILGLVTGLSAAYLVLRGTYRWWRPVRMSVSYTLGNVGAENMGRINVSVLNLASHSLYLTKLEAVGVQRRYPIRHILTATVRARLRHWLQSRDAVFRRSYDLEPHRKMEPRQRIDVKWPLRDVSPGRFYTHKFVVRATLSTGKVIESQEMHTPAAWKDPLVGGPPLRETM